MAPNLAVGLAIRLGIGRFADLRSLGEPSFLLLRPALDAGGFETRPYVVCGWAAGSGPRRVTETVWPRATTRQQAWGRGRSDSRKAQSAGPRAKPERAKTDKSGVPATLRPNARTDSSSRGIASRTLPPLPGGRALDGPRLSTTASNRAPGRGFHPSGLLAPPSARCNVLRSFYLSEKLRNTGPDARHVLDSRPAGTRC